MRPGISGARCVSARACVCQGLFNLGIFASNRLWPARLVAENCKPGSVRFARLLLGWASAIACLERHSELGFHQESKRADAPYASSIDRGQRALTGAVHVNEPGHTLTYTDDYAVVGRLGRA